MSSMIPTHSARQAVLEVFGAHLEADQQTVLKHRLESGVTVHVANHSGLPFGHHWFQGNLMYALEAPQSLGMVALTDNVAAQTADTVAWGEEEPTHLLPASYDDACIAFVPGVSAEQYAEQMPERVREVVPYAHLEGLTFTQQMRVLQRLLWSEVTKQLSVAQLAFESLEALTTRILELDFEENNAWHHILTAPEQSKKIVELLKGRFKTWEPEGGTHLAWFAGREAQTGPRSARFEDGRLHYQVGAIDTSDLPAAFREGIATPTFGLSVVVCLSHGIQLAGSWLQTAELRDIAPALQALFEQLGDTQASALIEQHDATRVSQGFLLSTDEYGDPHRIESLLTSPDEVRESFSDMRTWSFEDLLEVTALPDLYQELVPWHDADAELRRLVPSLVYAAKHDPDTYQEFLNECRSAPRILGPNGGVESLMEAGFEKPKVAVFERNAHKQLLAAQDTLDEQSVDILCIHDASDEDWAALQTQPDTMLCPAWVVWMQEVQDYETFAGDDGARRRKWRNKVRNIPHVSVVRARCSTSNPYYLQWLRLHEAVMATHASPIDRFLRFQRSAPETMDGIFIIDTSKDECIGGFVGCMEQVALPSALSFFGAVFSRDKEYKSYYLAERGHKAVLEYAADHGYRYLTFGSDSFVYGESLTLGLLRYKAAKGLRPCYVANTQHFHRMRRIYKFLRPEALTTPSAFFSFREDDSLQLNLVGMDVPEGLELDLPVVPFDLGSSVDTP